MKNPGDRAVLLEGGKGGLGNGILEVLETRCQDTLSQERKEKSLKL